MTVGNLGVERLRQGWREGCRGMEFAINFAKSNADIDSPSLLSSHLILIALAALGSKRSFEIGAEESAELRRWLLLANAKGRYTRGSSETILDQDLALIRDGGGPRELLDRLRQQAGTLLVSPEELEGRNRRSAIFKTMFLAFRAGGARDWKSHLAIAVDHSGVQHRLQFHHIFPKAVLRGSYTSRQADDIANLCFIAGKTNRQISDKAPSEYVPGILTSAGAAAFAAQCIPTDAALLQVSAYPEFLRQRRQQIAAALNAFLGGSA